LKDFDKVDVFKLNNAFTLRTCGKVERMLNDYQRALEELENIDVLEQNNAITLKTCGNVKGMSHD